MATPHLECSLDSWPMRSSSAHLCTHLSPCSHCAIALATPTRPPHPGVLALLPSPTGSSGRPASAPWHHHISAQGPCQSSTLGLSVPLASYTSFFIVLTCNEIILFINWPSCLLIGISEYKLLEGRHLVFSAHFVFPAPGLVHSRHPVNIY